MPGPVRVLHLAAGNLFGGIETLLCTLARFRGSEALDSEFGLCFEGQLSAALQQLGAPVHALGAVRLRNPISVARANLALGRLLRAARYDAVVTHGAWPHLVFGACVKLHGTQLVTWAHGAPLGRDFLDLFAARLRPDLLVANSRHTLQALGTRVGHVRTQVIYAPVEPQLVPVESRARIRRALGAPERAVVIAFAARLERWKGHELLLRAVSELERQTNADFRVWIAGGAQRPHEEVYLKELTDWVQGAGLSSRVTFLGQRSDVPALFAAADVFCQPNTGPEPFGIVFIEALYAGLPIVTTDMGGGKEIVDSSCGLLVEPEPKALAAALARLITDPFLRNQMAHAAPARARLLCEPEARIRELARAIAI
jgi:glycosyltransferase involved in cell wall biosynthesis